MHESNILDNEFVLIWRPKFFLSITCKLNHQFHFDTSVTFCSNILKSKWYRSTKICLLLSPSIGRMKFFGSSIEWKGIPKEKTRQIRTKMGRAFYHQKNDTIWRVRVGYCRWASVPTRWREMIWKKFHKNLWKQSSCKCGRMGTGIN